MNKINLSCDVLRKKTSMNHFLLIMRTAIILLFTCVFISVAETGHSQNAKVSLNKNNVNLKEVLNEIENQTDYLFIYNNEVNTNKTVSVKTKNGTVKTVLAHVLKDSDIDFSMEGNHIILSYIEKQLNEKNEENIETAQQQQGRHITGTIVDAQGEPIIGANIIEKGTSNGTITDYDGNFSLNVANNAVLRISYIGYLEQEVATQGKNSINVTLMEDTKTLDEVVVVGYGVQSKRDLSTSIAQLKSTDLVDIPVSDFRQAMVGKMPGVQVLQQSGDPEGPVSIRVRGISSATAGNEPLYIVDGIPTERGFANLNNNDIESIEVLKDASSAAIYGSRGSNGVIIITTKKGQSEKMLVNYNGYFGTSQVSKRLPMMNAYEFAEAARDGHNNSYLDEVPTGTPDDPNSIRPQSYHKIPDELFPYLRGESGLTDTDWQDAIYRKAITTSHDISISKKAPTVSYFVSGNYTKNEGVIIESDFEKYNLRLNLDGKHNKFSFGVNFAPSYSTSNRVNASGPYGGGGIVQSALAMPPVWPVYNEDDTFNFQGNGYWRIGNDYQHNEVLNPVALARLQSNVVDRYVMIGKLYGQYEFFKGFSYKLSLAGNYYSSHNDRYRSSELPLRGWSNYGKPSNPVGYSSSSFFFNWLVENTLNYQTVINDNHKINAVFVQSAQKETLKGNNVTATDYPNDYIQTITGGTVSKGSSEITQWSLASYLTRVQYSYQGRYMASAALRTDGSSRFGKNNRWGFFPSVSAAWRISDESFFKEKSALQFINDLKVRGSFGVTGNFQIGNYEHLSTLSSDDYILGANNGMLTPGYKPDKIKNDDLSWEKTSMTNIGLDLQAWQGLLGVTLDLYSSYTTDMLLNVPIPHLAGHSTTRMNIGKVNNRGIELQVSSQKKLNKNWSYNLTANFSKNINEVKALGPENAPIISSGGVSHAYWITQVGHPIGSYYLLVKDGIFENEEELKMYPHFPNTQAGDFRFVDVDGDGVIDMDKDRMIVGNYMPDFTYGWNMGLHYRQFDFSAAFQGVYGNEILNLNRRYIDNLEGNTNGTTIALDRWQSASNPGNGHVNRANRKQKGNNGRTSTWHIEDGSYLRLQNVTLGYALPKKLLQRFTIQRMRVYFSGQNLFTWTNYTGYNPEVSQRPTNALTPGEDYGTYPLARTYTVGLNITF